MSCHILAVLKCKGGSPDDQYPTSRGARVTDVVGPGPFAAHTSCRQIFLGGFALIAMVGCATPTPILATRTGVTYQGVYRWDLPEVAEKAQAHCVKYGKDARLVQDAKADSLLSFTCE